MMRSSEPTAVEVDTIVTRPLCNADSMPEKVKSSFPSDTSIRASYGAFAISKTYKKTGFANQIMKAKSMARASNVHGFSASVTGPARARNNCQMVTSASTDHARYCMMVNAVLTKGKYTSITVMSVPSAFKNSPDTASMRSVTMPAIQSMIPSNIQSNTTYPPRPSARIVAARDERLDVRHDQAERVEQDPRHDNALEPARRLVHRLLIAGDHAHDERDRRCRHRNDRADREDLQVKVANDGAEPIPDGLRRHDRLYAYDEYARDPDQRPIHGNAEPALL